MNVLRISTVLLLVFAVSMPSFADKREKKRLEIQEMREEVLTDLFRERPQARAEIDEAEGYAVFSNIGVQIFLIGGGGGRGVVRDLKSGNDTYMKMATASVGLGLGLKDFRAVFIFHDREALNTFIENGWDFSGEADAAAVSNDKGGEIGEAASVRKKVSVYQFTQAGLALQASLHGTKYWQDKKLNKK
ncbi:MULTISPECIES: YSC84-related protein [Kordiimonas]|jgi:lipid-binding SYLF domain-containing protein|uniref:Las17-binding protein actin regulator n=1 Tax=Kordiimonas lacus TaxID=637679 RepID=A0A1G7DAW4_9PROT|nr:MULTISPECIES: YSC84-related protein [Kordiimonas]SDE48788.1 Las17-binding protein actin regulator [Kordiimonas lacus]